MFSLVVDGNFVELAPWMVWLGFPGFLNEGEKPEFLYEGAFFFIFSPTKHYMEGMRPFIGLFLFYCCGFFL